METLAELPCPAPCHVALLPGGKRLAYAAYGAGVAATVDLETRSVRGLTLPDEGVGPNPLRQKKAYILRITVFCNTLKTRKTEGWLLPVILASVRQRAAILLFWMQMTGGHQKK